jgi:signal transduction histidine kinase/ligand-binding sensor domain-containing protein
MGRAKTTKIPFVVCAALLFLLLVCQRNSSQSTRLQTLGKPASRANQEAGNQAQSKIVASSGKGSALHHFDTWTTDNGLPQNSVNNILQTRDGYLWLTTNDGLVRYDGVHFTIFNAGNTPELKNSRFWQLYEDQNGNLWTITEDNKLIRYADGHFITYTTEDGLPHDSVIRLRDDAEGSVMIETAAGFVWWRDGKFSAQDPSPHRLYASIGYASRDGAIWYLDQTGLHRVENGRVTTDAPMSEWARAQLKFAYEDHQGELWLSVSKGILMKFKEGKFISYAQKDGLAEQRINVILDDRKGNLWLGLTDAGLFCFKDGRFTQYTTQDGLVGNNILSLYEDREGNLWIGTTAGLSRLRDTIITSYSTDNGLAANNIYPICQDTEGAIWIGSWKGLTKYKDGIFTPIGELFGVTETLVTALMTDREGSLWIGGYGSELRRCKDGKITLYELKDGLPDAVVRAIYQDQQGAVWIGTRSGLAKYQDGAFTVYTTKDGLPANSVNVILEDSQGNLWIGTQSGLGRYRDGQLNAYSQEASLDGHTVRAIYEDGDGALWIGTYDNGLVRLKDGRFTDVTIKQGLFNNGVFQILEDARENFWISCNLGIYRVSKKELTEYAEGRVKAITSIPYGKRDGMLNSECNGGGQPAGIKAKDGKLWFPTQGGVAVVDPEAVPVSVQPPPVMIEEVLRNNQPVAFREAVEIPSNIENFEIHYTGLSFIMSERIKFKYKLEGLDTDWVDAGTRRVAYYSHVAPGAYTFRVIAANRDGVWNLQGASVQLRIIPPFWKTWWFFSLVLAGFAGVVLLGYKLRVRQLEKARRAQEAFSQQLISSQESERKRIAAELHDSLGQHLLIIKNSALLGLHSLHQQDHGKEQLDDISATASQAIEEVREISYNLRPYQLDDLGLTKAIEFIVAKVAGSSEIRFASQLDPIDNLFTPEAEINIYRIVQECLNNIVKHSRASAATIRIERQVRKVDITIQDNGRGFNPEKTAKAEPKGGGFGLKGISERARMLGATYVIHSAAGQGTTITLNLEANNGRREK